MTLSSQKRNHRVRNYFILAFVLLSAIGFAAYVILGDEDNTDKTSSGKREVGIIQNSEVFSKPDSWVAAANKSIGIQFFTPQSWSGGNVSGPRNPIENDTPVMQYEIVSSSKRIDSNDGTSVQVRISTPANLDSCKVSYLESIDIVSLGDNLNVVFCESDSTDNKISKVLIAEGQYSTDEEYSSLGTTLNDKPLELRITFSNPEDQKASQQSKVYREFTLDELQVNEEFQTAVNILRTIIKIESSLL